MIRLRHKMLIRALRLLDQLVLMAAAVGVFYFFQSVTEEGYRPPLAGFGRFADSVGILLLVVGWIAIFDYSVKYRADRFVGLAAQLKDLVKATTLASFWFLLISAIFSLRGVNPISITLFWVAVTALGVLSRFWMRWGLMSARRSGYNYRFLLIVGTNERSAELAAKIEASPELGYKLVGFVAETDESARQWRESEHPGNVLGCTHGLREILERERVDEMLVCLSVESKFKTVTGLLREARDLGIVLRIVPDHSDGAIFRKFHVEEFEDELVITFFRERLLLQLLAKKVIDLTVSALALIVLSPLMLAVALVIKLTSPGPVLFVQDRVGMNQRRFRLYKFRSMVADAEQRKKDLAHLNENDGPAFKIRNDPRVTPIGRLIRKTSIDELPQLFNVLKGEMSLVGPRPPLPDEVSKYDWLFRRRLSVKPGITCVWQISGRSDTSFEEWMKMDKDYVENWSLWLDFKILLKTIPAVLFGRGAS